MLIGADWCSIKVQPGFFCQSVPLDDVLLYIYPPTFSDFHSVHWCNWCYKSHSKSLKQYQSNWCHKSQMLNVEYKMSNVKCQINKNVKYEMSNVKCQTNVECGMSNVKCQMSIRLNLSSERTSGASPVILSFNHTQRITSSFQLNSNKRFTSFSDVMGWY